MEFTTAELLQAQSHVYNLTLSYLKSMSLKAAIDLRIADVLHKHGKPMPLPELISSLSIHPSKTDTFRRLMRALVHQRIFSTVDESQDSYLLTPTSHLLLSGISTSLTPFVQLILHPIVSHTAEVLALWFTSPEEEIPTPFWLFHGKGIFEVADGQPEFNRLFNEGMASDAGLVVEAVMRTCGDVFRGLESLVDVSGGTGAMAMAIADAFPEMKCTVFDLPHVVAGRTEIKGVRFVGGDMFVSVPSATAALLKWVLHDWSDEDCIKILTHCKEAIQSKDNEGKIIIIDIVVGAVMDNHANAEESQLLFDLLMLTATTGKERNESEWQDLFFKAGFTSYKITPLPGGIRSVIEVYP
ncbi:hypothetical protein J5N97_001494 [Dioscorea zingiberensis]|uniref:Uncharacterized protein n=1 Tax=Dioscorea zingiberensis TaxID=325984 RepID=A0A9D5H274_9LILI|nr:hypothetical protein J5N97_001494 [Dioscorea zingiberensis]